MTPTAPTAKALLIALLLIVFGAGLYITQQWSLKTGEVEQGGAVESAQNEEDRITYINASSDLIKVTLPYPGAVTGKTFSVIGEARGNWYFEASFPIEVLDKNGTRLAISVAQAQGEWMTTEFVPFVVEIKAPESYIGQATIVLHKDNPSGLSEHDASMSFPITIEY